jgi:outer membrane protein assembly factor BamB
VQAALAALAVVLFVPATSSAWRVIPAGATQAGLIAIDARRDVFAAISLRPSRQSITTAVVKLARTDGGEIWRRPFHGRGDERSDEILDLQVAPNGDVVAAGNLVDNGHSSFFVGRLIGSDGRVRWRRLIHGRRHPSVAETESARAIVVDAAGDVIAVGAIEGTTTAQYHSTNDLVVVKLDGRTGEERWRFLLNGTADDYDSAGAVAVDGMGDVIAIGGVSEGQWPSERPVTVVLKLARDDGRLLWRRDGSEPVFSDVVIDGQGDVMISSGSNPFVPGSFDVIKLAGTTGERLWAGAVTREDDDAYYFWQLGVLPSGDVAVTGNSYSYADQNNSWITARLDGKTGAERWRQVLRGSDGYGAGGRLAIAKSGDIVVGGVMRNVRSCYDVVAARLEAETGAVFDLRTIDGTATATECERPDCGASRIPCGPTRKGIDQDNLWALAIDGNDRFAVAGVICNGPRGRERGFVAALPTARSASPPAPRSSSASRP